MNPAMVIARREVRAYFNSPVAYIVVSAFTIIAGGIFFFFKFFLAQEASMRGFGIQAVPTFIFDRKFGVSGAHPPEALASAIREALESK